MGLKFVSSLFSCSSTCGHTLLSTGRGMPIPCRYYHTKPQW